VADSKRAQNGHARTMTPGVPAYTHVGAVRARRLPSLLKWAGGKEQELRYILPMLPASFHHYYEPFVGGGAVFFSLLADKKFINDRSAELIGLYRMVAENNAEFFVTLDGLLRRWNRVSRFVDTYSMELVALYKAYALDEYPSSRMKEALARFVLSQMADVDGISALYGEKHSENFSVEMQRNLAAKAGRMKQLESKKGTLPDRDIAANLECALKSAFYMHLRHLYNNIRTYEIPPGAATAIFYLVRENAYASMFRYNGRGEFNVPYGGISYNRKDLARKVASMRHPEMQRHFTSTLIENMDFEAFLCKHRPGPHDFVFLDPPYDSEFSTYTQNAFDGADQQRLAHYLLQRCEAQFMLVIKNTPAILDLYAGKGLHIQTFDKKYLVSFQDRNRRESEHLLITNYETVSLVTVPTPREKPAGRTSAAEGGMAPHVL
jgi:DNA adenine methylase